MLLLFLLKGIAVGIVIAIPVGPVGVLCVRRTIFEGSVIGFVSGLGAASADMVFGIIAAFGLTFVRDLLLGYQDFLRAAGGAFLLYVGLSALIKRFVPTVKTVRTREDVFGAFISTFALTITNPVTILAFLGVFAAVGFSGEEATLAGAAMLVAGVVIGSLAWWLGLGLGAGLFRKSFREIHLIWLNRISGVILSLSGAVLLGSLLYDNL